MQCEKSNIVAKKISTSATFKCVNDPKKCYYTFPQHMALYYTVPIILVHA